MNLCMKQMASHSSILAGEMFFPGKFTWEILAVDTGAWQAIVHGVAKKLLSMHACMQQKQIWLLLLLLLSRFSRVRLCATP